MEEIKELYLQGMITEEDYRDRVIDTSAQIFNSLQYKILSVLGSGSFGSVLEVENITTKKTLAVKIVVEHSVSKSELYIWPKLKNPNLLPLVATNYFDRAHAYIFMMPKCPSALSEKIHDMNFLLDSTALVKSVSWMKGILSGLSYLHENEFCHLDLKIDNVLISDSEVAVITDFGFTTTAAEFTSGYGSPFIYRAPETRPISGYDVAVDGQKFDMWTVGMLALEMFTREGFYEEVTKWPILSKYWEYQIYPTVFNMLQKNNFCMLMSNAFPAVFDCAVFAPDIVSLIISCLQINPAARPTPNELMQQKLFGGLVFTDLAESDVWCDKASKFELEDLIKLYKQLEANRQFEIKLIKKRTQIKAFEKLAEECQDLPVENHRNDHDVDDSKVEVDDIKAHVDDSNAHVDDSNVHVVEDHVDDIKANADGHTYEYPNGESRSPLKNKRRSFVAWARKKKGVIANALRAFMPARQASKK